MSIDATKTVAALGAGTMGNGIARVFAKSGSLPAGAAPVPPGKPSQD